MTRRAPPTPEHPPLELLSEVKALREQVHHEAQHTLQGWKARLGSGDALESGHNLAEYLALRGHDLRELQARLSSWGLSSLGRAEGRVRSSLDAVLGALEALCGLPRSVPAPESGEGLAGRHLLEMRAEQLFGPCRGGREVRILVTLPTDPPLQAEPLERLLEAGMDCVRLNCAHGDPEGWAAMLGALDEAAAEVNHRCPVLMDLAGPKLRLESVSGDRRLRANDHFHLVLEQVVHPHGQVHATLPIAEVFRALEVSQTVAYDDGKLYAVVEEATPEHALLRVTHARDRGSRLKPDKGIHFPGLDLRLDPLTDHDLENLDFVARHADLVGYSFVQDGTDLERLQNELEARGVDLSRTAIIAKIETARAVRHLPELIVQGLSRGAFGVMIARGDLALELGFERLAEMQEELLWMCEAASVPVIWATGVLEGLVKEGLPSRGEMTDAAMGARAECVMLNKGAHQLEGVTALSDVLSRMGGHLHKKAARLRALSSWR